MAVAFETTNLAKLWTETMAPIKLRCVSIGCAWEVDAEMAECFLASHMQYQHPVHAPAPAQQQRSKMEKVPVLRMGIGKDDLNFFKFS